MYVKCPLEVCRQRDVKGLYKLVDEGKIHHFTGVDDPYEEPEQPDLVLETATQTIEESVDVLLAKIIAQGYLQDKDAQLVASGTQTDEKGL